MVLIQPPLYKVMKWLVAVFLALIGGLPSHAKLTPEQVASLPKSLTRPVTFREDVKPILEASCVKCHARGQSKGGLRIETREQLLKGGDSGAATGGCWARATDGTT